MGVQLSYQATQTGICWSYGIGKRRCCPVSDTTVRKGTAVLVQVRREGPLFQQAEVAERPDVQDPRLDAALPAAGQGHLAVH